MMSKYSNGVIITSVVTSIACIGDTFLYSVLPVYAETIGISDFLVGLLLSINRFIRLAFHGMIASFLLRYGVRKIVLASSIAAVLSTLLYMKPDYIILIILARVIWGISYSVFRQSNLFYVANADYRRNHSFALSQGIKPIGPFLILIIGPYIFTLFGYEKAILLIAILTFIGIWVAYLLPDLKVNSDNYEFKNILRFSWFNLLLFLVSFISNGFIVVILFLLFSSQTLSSDSLLITVALYLLIGRLISFLLPFVLLKSFSILSVTFHFYFGISLLIVGLCLLYLVSHEIGLVIVFIGSTIIENAGPLEALQKSKFEKMEIVTSVTFWWDAGKAIGAFLGIIIYKNCGGDLVFLAVAIILIIGLLKYYRIDKLKLV